MGIAGRWLAILVWILTGVIPGVVYVLSYSSLTSHMRSMYADMGAYAAAVHAANRMEFLLLVGCSIAFLVGAVAIMMSGCRRKVRILLLLLQPCLQWSAYHLAALLRFFSGS